MDWVVAVGYDNTKTVIDGGIVTSGTVQLAGSDTSIKAGITGEGTTDDSVRLWAGATQENRATAPFRVLQDGSLVASKANITGRIIVTGGEIGGIDITEDGDLELYDGTYQTIITANQIANAEKLSNYYIKSTNNSVNHPNINNSSILSQSLSEKQGEVNPITLRFNAYPLASMPYKVTVKCKIVWQFNTYGAQFSVSGKITNVALTLGGTDLFNFNAQYTIVWDTVNSRAYVSIESTVSGENAVRTLTQGSNIGITYKYKDTYFNFSSIGQEIVWNSLSVQQDGDKPMFQAIPMGTTENYICSDGITMKNANGKSFTIRNGTERLSVIADLPNESEATTGELYLTSSGLVGVKS
jgi:hypothetical protein